jgi:hypothetical protein
LTEAARTALLRYLEHPHELVLGLLAPESFRRFLSEQTPALPGTVAYLRDDPTAPTAIRGLHHVNRARIADRDRRQREVVSVFSDATTPGMIDATTAENIFELVLAVDGFICTVVFGLLRDYPRTDLSVVFLEFWDIDTDDFSSEAAGNELDYNDDDGLPGKCESPHQHEADLIVEAITARLFKRHGVELLLTWVDAVNTARAESA